MNTSTRTDTAAYRISTNEVRQKVPEPAKSPCNHGSATLYWQSPAAPIRVAIKDGQNFQGVFDMITFQR